MKQIIAEVGDYLGQELDGERYLIAGNAFGKLSLFVYKQSDLGTDPFAIIKVPGNEQGRVQSQNEYDTLIYLQQLQVPATLSPAPLGSLEVAGEVCFLQKVIVSDLCYSMLKPNTKRFSEKEFLWITEKLITIYRSTRETENQPGKSYGQCFLHGDFWPGNLGRQGDSIVLYDLEFALPQGKPLWDLLHFGLYFQIASANTGKVGKIVTKGNYDRDDENRTFSVSADTVQQAFLSGTRLAKILRKCVSEYITRCGIERSDALDLIQEYYEVDRDGINELPRGWAEKIMPF